MPTALERFEDIIEKSASIAFRVLDNDVKELAAAAYIIDKWIINDGKIGLIISMPGDSIEDFQIVAVNKFILDELKYTLEEWRDGTAIPAVINPDDLNIAAIFAREKLTTPYQIRLIAKGKPPQNPGDLFEVHGINLSPLDKPLRYTLIEKSSPKDNNNNDNNNDNDD